MEPAPRHAAASRDVTLISPDEFSLQRTTAFYCIICCNPGLTAFQRIERIGEFLTTISYRTEEEARVCCYDGLGPV